MFNLKTVAKLPISRMLMSRMLDKDGRADGLSSSQLLVLLWDLETSGVSLLSLTNMADSAILPSPISVPYSSWVSLFFSWSLALVRSSREVTWLYLEPSTRDSLGSELPQYSPPTSSPSTTLWSLPGLVSMWYMPSWILSLGIQNHPPLSTVIKLK